jgi:hypothetical protein
MRRLVYWQKKKKWQERLKKFRHQAPSLFTVYTHIGITYENLIKFVPGSHDISSCVWKRYRIGTR